MCRDPLVQEIRAIREAYAQRFSYDLHAMYRDLKQLEQRSGRPVVSRPPRRAPPDERVIARRRDGGD